jgi:diacylglycerol kinase (ATP)
VSSSPAISDIAPHLPRPIALIINTHSRRGKAQFGVAVAAIKAAGIPVVQAHAVDDKKETERLLRQEVEAGANLVIVGGGDGTLSACAGYLVNTPVAMGVLPLGTGNTLARSLGLPLDLEGAAQTIARGHVELMDVGRVNGRVFLNSVSLGLSAEIAHALDPETKKRLGLLAWPVVGARVLWKHRAIVFKVTSPQKTFHVRTHQLVVSNGRYVAGPVAAAPDASIQDSCLRVFVLGGARHSSLARTAWKWLIGRHTTDPEARYFAANRLRINAVRRPVPADVDGEINERTPLDIEVLPAALRVVVPHNFEAESV